MLCGNNLIQGDMDPCEEVTESIRRSDCGKSTYFNQRRKYHSRWL